MTHLTTIYKIVVNTKNSHPSPKKNPITSSHPLHDLPQPHKHIPHYTCMTQMN